MTSNQEQVYDWGIDRESAGDTQDDNDVMNKEFLPGRTLYENDVTTDEEDEEEKRTFGDLDLFFHAIGEPQHTPLFVQQKVTLGQLLDFDETDLINCGIELVGDRKKILENVAQWHSEKWVPTSLHDMSGKKMLTAPGIYISINDMNKHIEYIGASFRYIRRVVQKKPEILELGKDYCGIKRISSEMEDLVVTYEKTGENLQSLRRELKKHFNDPTLQPPNEIDEFYVTRAKLAKSIIPITVISMGILTGLGFIAKYSLNAARSF